MKHFLRTYLPSSSIAFTFVILLNAARFMILGVYSYTISSSFILQLTALIIAIQLISVVCDHLPFRTKKSYFAAFFVMEYLMILVASYVWYGYTFTADSFFHTTFIAVFIAILIDRYFAAVQRHEADEINRLLQANEKKEEQIL